MRWNLLQVKAQAMREACGTWERMWSRISSGSSCQMDKDSDPLGLWRGRDIIHYYLYEPFSPWNKNAYFFSLACAYCAQFNIGAYSTLCIRCVLNSPIGHCIKMQWNMRPYSTPFQIKRMSMRMRSKLAYLNCAARMLPTVT